MNEPIDDADNQLQSELQALWYSLSQRPWFTLAVIPAGRDNTFFACKRLAEELRELCELYRGVPTRLILEESPRLPEANNLAHDIRAEGHSAHPMIVAIPSVLDNQVGLLLAQSADAVLFAVTLGTTEQKAAAL